MRSTAVRPRSSPVVSSPTASGRVEVLATCSPGRSTWRAARTLRHLAATFRALSMTRVVYASDRSP